MRLARVAFELEEHMPCPDGEENTLWAFNLGLLKKPCPLDLGPPWAFFLTFLFSMELLSFFFSSLATVRMISCFLFHLFHVRQLGQQPHQMEAHCTTFPEWEKEEQAQSSSGDTV